jgi:hypothetical protein
LVISEKSFSLTRSTGSDSAGVTERLPLNDTSAHSNTAACRPVDIARPFIRDHFASALLGHQRDLMKPADSRPITRIMVP